MRIVMNVLVTGADGFIGKNLVEALKQRNNYNLKLIDKENSKIQLIEGILEADFIFHLAGVNRPKDDSEFYKGNQKLTEEIIDVLKSNKKTTPILITSSIQAELNNPYGKSKKLAEEALLNYNIETGAKVYIYRLPNVFGKWCRPNYNSAVATFCNSIAKGEEVWISDKDKELTLVYIDDLVKALISTLNSKKILSGYATVEVEYKATLGKIVDLLSSFKCSRENLNIPDIKDQFTKKLYSTYLSYLPEEKFSYPLKMNIDERGSFTEFIKSSDGGQISINISKPGIMKGNHWHNTKNEKFLVVSGTGLIRFRKINSDKIIEYKVSGERLEVVDIPVGYTHSIVNIGETDMVTVIWVNEVFNPEEPDTIGMEV